MSLASAINQAFNLDNQFESLTFNLLSKNLGEYIQDYADRTQNADEGKQDRVQWSLNIKADIADRLLVEAKETLDNIERHFKRLEDLGAYGSVDLASYPHGAKLKSSQMQPSYSAPSELVETNANAFLQSLILYFENKSTIDRVYKRYLVIDDFGSADSSRAIKKISEFVEKNVAFPLGTIPLGDCKMLILLVCIMLVSLEEIADEGVKQSDKNSSVLGREYEDICYSILCDCGFSVNETPSTGDYGADLIASKNSLTFIIQCKNYQNSVGIGAIQEAHSAKEYYEGDFAVVVTEAKFTNAALKMADKLEVLCLSKESLPKLIDLVC